MRLESMVAMAQLGTVIEFMRRFIASAINVIIQIARLVDGTRKVISVQEVTGMEGPVVTLQEIFSFKQTGMDAEGKVKGFFQFHGVRPKFIDKLAIAGISVPDDIFNPENIVEI
jgi:pilus assembly protein CpaF